MGESYHIAFPEYKLLILLQDGDIVTFDASEVMHSLVAPTLEAEEDAVEKAPHVCLSFYTNGKQVREVRKLMGRLDSEDEVVDMSGLTVYEIMRLERIKRNRAKLRELGLL